MRGHRVAAAAALALLAACGGAHTAASPLASTTTQVSSGGGTASQPAPAATGAPYRNCPKSAGGTTTTTAPSSPGLSVVRESGLLFSPDVAVVAGPSTIYIAGPAQGCSDHYLSGHLGLDRTTDDGRHFTRVALPLDVDDVGTIGFASPSRGYAVGESSHPYSPGGIAVIPNIAWITVDGATSWKPIRLPAGTGILTMTASATETYIVTDKCNPRGLCICPKRCGLIRIPAGATSGITSTLPAAAPGPTRNQTTSDFALAATANNLWIFDTISHRVLTSSDNGKTFETFPLASALNGCAYHASTSLVLWADCAREYRSVNAGRSFAPLPAQTGVQYWDPVDATTAYIVTRSEEMGSGSLHRSSDGGQTFTNLGVPTPDSVCYPTFSTATAGLALCELPAGTTDLDGVIGTTDGGQTWSAPAQP